MVRIKICGITNWTDARLAVDEGADILGFNFYQQSPRYVAPEEARRIISRLPRRVQAAGVFVNEPAASILALAQWVDLNLLQLHGTEPASRVRQLARHYPVIKAFRVNGEFQLGQLEQYSAAEAFLLDGSDGRRYGGSGQTFDWSIAKKAARYGMIVLAGGLTPENVGEAILATRPFAVDVCGGVEAAPGKKDPELLKKFLRAVKKTRRRLE